MEESVWNRETKPEKQKTKMKAKHEQDRKTEATEETSTTLKDDREEEK